MDMARESALQVKYHCPVCDRAYDSPEEVEMCKRRHKYTSLMPNAL